MAAVCAMIVHSTHFFLSNARAAQQQCAKRECVVCSGCSCQTYIVVVVVTLPSLACAQQQFPLNGNKIFSHNSFACKRSLGDGSSDGSPSACWHSHSHIRRIRHTYFTTTMLCECDANDFWCRKQKNDRNRTQTVNMFEHRTQKRIIWKYAYMQWNTICVRQVTDWLTDWLSDVGMAFITLSGRLLSPAHKLLLAWFASFFLSFFSLRLFPVQTMVVIAARSGEQDRCWQSAKREIIEAIIHEWIDCNLQTYWPATSNMLSPCCGPFATS